MDSPQVGELWQVRQGYYLPEDFAVMRQGTVGTVLSHSFRGLHGLLTEIALVLDGSPRVVLVSPAVMAFWERVEDGDE